MEIWQSYCQILHFLSGTWIDNKKEGYNNETLYGKVKGIFAREFPSWINTHKAKTS